LSHAARLAIQRRPSGGRTTIDSAVQAKIESVLAAPGPLLPAGSQAAAVVIEIRTGDILALVGSRDPDRPRDGQVNGATAPRSPGSTLKPFIYAAAIEAGLIDARTILHDIPIERAGWTPANFDRQFAGPVLAAEALRRSLNVPAILVAEGTGLDHCLGTIEAVGVRLPAVAHERAGLAVVTGAVEVTLLDLVNGYATLGRGGTRMAPRLFLDEAIRPAAVLSPDACAVVNEILSSRNRRPRGTEGRDEHSIPWFMWKTGTSAGRRDAWAVGHNHRFAIGVWIGRFDGGGDPGFVGAEAAEPLLASLFDLACLRNPIDPPPATSRPASRPLPPPPELADALRILSPAPGATFIAVSGSTTLHVRANRTAALAWFLDGRVVAASDLERLVLPPGRHELRCVGADGTAAASRFTVRSMPGSPGHNVPLASLRNEGLH
jgi:penicillin-binding protein 1C